MNRSDGTPSARPSPRIGEDNMSMYFDFGSSAQHQDGQQSFQAMPTSTSSDNGHESSAPRGGGIRVSLACIPCRSRHVKCGAEMPNCSRCVQDDKPCFYAKSRRGMRDRNAPRKRVSLRESGKASPNAQAFGNPNPLAYPVGGSSSESYAGPASDASASPGSSNSSRIGGRQADPRRLLDLYYNFFHKAQPFVLPRYYFLARLESDPESLKYLFPVMQYIGSLYSPAISSSELRDHALSQLDSPSLPPNGFSVAALLIAAIAVHSEGEDDYDHARSILDRAIYMALEIRMNSRTFANMERDPVLAESWRRVYWGMYLADSMLAGIKAQPTFLLFTVEANVELPCEECDYDGIIPRPRTLSEYEARDFEDEETVFSSFTYLIDLTRIFGSLLGINSLRGKDIEPAVANADAMLVSWRLHLPKEKQGVVDKNEEVDEMLFQAHNLLQLLLVHIHRPLSRLYHSPIEAISSCAPPPPNVGSANPSPAETHNQWLHTRKTLEAAESSISLYALPIPILQHSPFGICGIVLATLASLSACSFILSGSEWYRTRDRVRLGIGGLKKFGEVWKRARKNEKEVKRIARAVFSTRNGVEETLGMMVPPSNSGMSSSHSETEQFGWTQEMLHHQGSISSHGDSIAGGSSLHVGGHDAYNHSGAFEDLNGIDYLSMLENAQALSRVGS